MSDGTNKNSSADMCRSVSAAHNLHKTVVAIGRRRFDVIQADEVTLRLLCSLPGF